MKRLGSRAGLILAVVAIAVVALAATAAARTTSSKASPIVIGWAYDSTGAMAPFDGPALAAAQLRVKQVNAQGRGRRTSVADQDVQHAGQQAGCGEGVRAEAARWRRERHLHDL